MGLFTTVLIPLTFENVWQAMSGSGLSCADCSLDGGEAPPRWFIVVQSKGRSNRQLQEEGGVTGRVESASNPVCEGVYVICMCVYRYVYTYVYVYMYIHIYYVYVYYVCVYMYVCMCVYVRMYLHTHTMYVRVRRVCVYVNIHTCVCVCV